MTETRLTPVESGRWRLAGTMDFTTVPRLATAGERLFKDSGPAPGGALILDLAEVESANSAGLALLLEWSDMARARGIHLSYANVPDSLLRIAAFSNLQDLLPVAA
ncbi:Sulfate transporter/antisigma-factor antagonist STAS [Thiorhodococcus drewsii AZ1]|uniref:Sulfate transporter/antisigma-factor antagonist STAS n=1 Tax=Thiorhodococcus drewsii AZ1 TaxID=765913 RepID=G2E236_9GAMM|nr:STAS domain-containing protein [Thiorhodococcus drewsii]EGV30985.1 Sulfate transporter/antisigma-factor antagonist STAS [Thiorhodococcus drewsii AZ1]